MFRRHWISVFEWWAGQPSSIRYGVAIAFLSIAAIEYFWLGQVPLWSGATGFVLLIFAILIRDV